MPTNIKIKIEDNSELRMKIDELYEKINQVDLAKWSLLMAKHILDIVDIKFHSIEEIESGFKINELWQIGQARVHDI